MAPRLRRRSAATQAKCFSAPKRVKRSLERGGGEEGGRVEGRRRENKGHGRSIAGERRMGHYPRVLQALPVRQPRVHLHCRDKVT